MSDKDETSHSLLLVGSISILILISNGYLFFKEHLLRTWELYQSRILWLIGLSAALSLIAGMTLLWNQFLDWFEKSEQEEKTKIYLGRDEKKSKIFLTQKMRTKHTQVIGTTGSGKTESVILPWAIQDIQNGAGVIIIDGKADRSFVDKLYAYAEKAGRAHDFRYFSLVNREESCSFNPLAGGSVQEVAERVFSSFQSDNEYYKSVQYVLFVKILELIYEQNQVPTFTLVQRLLTDRATLKNWLEELENEDLKRELMRFNDLSEREKEERVSGIVAKLMYFTSSEMRPLFNTETPQIDLDVVLRNKLICYFELPTMLLKEMGQATGKMVLQCLQSAVARRHLGKAGSEGFVSCYLDDFQDYIYDGFQALLNKSRSANIGMVFSHQSLGDLEKVSPAFAETVMTNTNIKIVMRTNDPDTSEKFSKIFGTVKSEKTTSRMKVWGFLKTKTGDVSVRDVEEFYYHPNLIKLGLQTGEGLVLLPYNQGVKRKKIKFCPLPDVKGNPLPRMAKEIMLPSSVMSPKKERAKVQKIFAQTKTELLTLEGNNEQIKNVISHPTNTWVS